MKSGNADLAKLQELWTQSSNPQNGPDCPPPESIWDAVQGDATPAEVERLLEHTLGCAACSEDWRLARAISAEAKSCGAHPVAAAKRSGRWRYKPAWLAVAAAVIIAFGIHLAVQTNQPPAFRGQPSQTLSPTVQSLVPEGTSLPRDGFVLKWRPGPEGTLYTLRVVTEDLQPLVTVRNLDESEYLVPASSLEKLPPGARLFWEVRMESPDGSRTNSPVFSVRLEP